jgi:hypothetical protein
MAAPERPNTATYWWLALVYGILGSVFTENRPECPACMRGDVWCLYVPYQGAILLVSFGSRPGASWRGGSTPKISRFQPGEMSHVAYNWLPMTEAVAQPPGCSILISDDGAPLVCPARTTGLLTRTTGRRRARRHRHAGLDVRNGVCPGDPSGAGDIGLPAKTPVKEEADAPGA